MSVKTPLSIDEMFNHVGGFGRYQWMLDFIFSVMCVPQTYQILIMYFAGISPAWRCKSNITGCVTNMTYKSTDNLRCELNRQDWEFIEHKEFSVVTQFDLVCDHAWLVNMTTTIFFLGWLVGAIILGWVADRYGRKTTYFPSTGILIVTGFITSFSPNITTFIILRSISGLVTPATYVNAFVMMSEVVSGKRRSLAGIIIFFAFAMALCTLSLKAYLLQNWKTLFIVCTAPYIFVLFFYPFVPESIRWLKVHGKGKELNSLFKKIARWNKRELDDDMCIEEESQSEKVDTNKANLLDLFRTKKMAIYTSVQGFLWFINAMVYFGLTLAASDLGGSLYLNFFFVTIVGVPSVFVAIYLSDNIGRKKTVLGNLVLAGISCLIVAFIPKVGKIKYIRVCFGVVGQLFIGTSFSAIFTWSVEILPTSLRAGGMGFLQVASRAGAAVAPFVAKGLATINPAVPFIVMGSLAIITFFVSFLLPETKGQLLKEVMGDSTELKSIFDMNESKSSSEEGGDGKDKMIR